MGLKLRLIDFNLALQRQQARMARIVFERLFNAPQRSLGTLGVDLPLGVGKRLFLAPQRHQFSEKCVDASVLRVERFCPHELCLRFVKIAFHAKRRGSRDSTRHGFSAGPQQATAKRGAFRVEAQAVVEHAYRLFIIARID
ncbi:MAG: hypothetical protein JHC40_02670 [Burkholderiales bacterium]|nr:hypothetical protein [Burkholderiales bacterium]